MSIRSGRFTLDEGTGETTIIKGRAGAFYRILNSGKHAFKVKPRGNGSEILLMPTLSIDVSTGDEVKIVNHDGKPIEGIYDYLDVSLPVRSGRFKTDATGKAPTENHPIIDLTGGNDQAWYRILNSGKNLIYLVEDDAAVNADTPKVGMDQSFDFEVGRSIRKIFVQGDADKPIEGIYEFLGREA